MRVYYINADLNKENVPKDCYFIETKTEEECKPWTLEQLQWTMWKWLNY